MELALTGVPISAEKAREWGVVNYVTEDYPVDGKVELQTDTLIDGITLYRALFRQPSVMENLLYLFMRKARQLACVSHNFRVALHVGSS